MSQDIGPGDVVECVDASPPTTMVITEMLDAGKTYVVHDVLASPIVEPCSRCGNRHSFVQLRGGSFCWCPGRFRKRPPEREALFRALEATKPGDMPQDAPAPRESEDA